MNKYILGIFKYNIKSFLRIRKNVSFLSIIDSNSEISNKAVIARGCKLNNVVVGDYSYISKNTDISNCKIGKFCSIAPNIKIGFGMHPTNLLSTSPLFYTNRNMFGYAFDINKDIKEFNETIIENDVWIGLNAIILDGVKIGNGAIIGAGAVVTKDVESYSIVGGIPAKFIRYRFDEYIRKILIESKWWDLSNEEIIKLAKHVELEVKRKNLMRNV